MIRGKLDSWPRRIRTITTLLAVSVALSVGCKGTRSAAPPEPRRALPFYPDYNKDATQGHKRGLNFDESGSGVFDAFLPCDNGENCDGATEVHVKIIPEVRAHVAPLEQALKRGSSETNLGGYLVAKIINIDREHRFYAFGMARNDTAYLWAGPTQQKGNRFAIYRIRDNEAAVLLAYAAMATICRRGSFGHAEVHSPPRYCNQNETIYSTAGAQTGAMSSTSGRQILLASNPIRQPAFLAMVMHTQGLWISCSGGCCQTGGWAPM